METRQRNQRGEGARLRRELLEAAMRVLDRSPTIRLSLRAVAGEAGVKPPSVYAHFANADDMMGAIIRECWNQMGEAMSLRALEASSSCPFTALKAQMSAYVRYAMERPSRYQLLFALGSMGMAGSRELPGPVLPASRNVLPALERMEVIGYKLPMQDLLASGVLILSIAHGRIALAQTAPHLNGNSARGVETFVLRALESMFKLGPQLAVNV
jgi:AcrR family transcriptional regulator